MSRILPAPLVFISGYANTENVFYCLTVAAHFYVYDNFNKVSKQTVHLDSASLKIIPPRSSKNVKEEKALTANQ